MFSNILQQCIDVWCPKFRKLLPQKPFHCSTSIQHAVSLTRSRHRVEVTRKTWQMCVKQNKNKNTFCQHYLWLKQFRFKSIETDATGWQSFGPVQHAIVFDRTWFCVYWSYSFTFTGYASGLWHNYHKNHIFLGLTNNTRGQYLPTTIYCVFALMRACLCVCGGGGGRVCVCVLCCVRECMCESAYECTLLHNVSCFCIWAVCRLHISFHCWKFHCKLYWLFYVTDEVEGTFLYTGMIKRLYCTILLDSFKYQYAVSGFFARIQTNNQGMSKISTKVVVNSYTMI